MINKKDLLSYKTDNNNELLYNNTDNFMNFIKENNLEDYTNDILDDESVKSDIIYNLNKFGWESVKYMLEDIKNTNENHYARDGYGNLRNVTNIDINCIINDIIHDLDKEGEYEL